MVHPHPDPILTGTGPAWGGSTGWSPAFYRAKRSIQDSVLHSQEWGGWGWRDQHEASSSSRLCYSQWAAETQSHLAWPDPSRDTPECSGIARDPAPNQALLDFPSALAVGFSFPRPDSQLPLGLCCGTVLLSQIQALSGMGAIL